MNQHHLYKLIKASVHFLTVIMLPEGSSDELNFAHMDRQALISKDSSFFQHYL